MILRWLQKQGAFSLVLTVLCYQIMISESFSQENSEEALSDVLQRQTKGRYLGKIRQTIQLQKRILRYNEKKFGVESVEILEPLEALAWMSMEQLDFKSAESSYRRIIKIRKKKLPRSEENIQKLGKAYFSLGDAYLYLSFFSLAATSYTESISLLTDPVQRGDALARKGTAYEGLKDTEKALEAYLSALREYESAKVVKPEYIKPLDKSILRVYKRMPELLQFIGENVEAKRYQELIEELEGSESETQEANNEF